MALDKRKVKKLISLYEKYGVANKVAKEMGLSTTTVIHYLRENGIDTSKKSVKKRKLEEKAKKLKKILRDNPQGITYKEISEYMGLPHSIVKGVILDLIKYGYIEADYVLERLKI